MTRVTPAQIEQAEKLIRCALPRTPNARVSSDSAGFINQEAWSAVAQEIADTYNVARFWSKVDVGRRDQCWEWRKYKNPDGYGLFRVGGSMRGAHRIAYMISGKVIPDGMVIDHLCRNRCCVNPKHLRAVPSYENTMAVGSLAPAKRQAEQTHCFRGHEYTEENTYHTGGKRECRFCRRDRMTAWRQRKREAQL